MSEEDRQRWNSKYETGDHASQEVSQALVELRPMLPSVGRALDVAGGAGRNSIWLAQRGLEVTLVDVSEVALSIAASRAQRSGMTIKTMRIDVEEQALPSGPWQLIVTVHFLWRPLFADFAKALAPGGTLVCIHPTTSNLQRHAKPSERFLLEDGELPKLIRDLDLVYHREGWLSEGRHEAVIVARKPKA